MIARTTSLELALRLHLDHLTEIAGTMDEARRAFDADERRGAYSIEHSPWCPDFPNGMDSMDYRGRCACGALQMLRELQTACALLSQVREGIAKCVEAVAGENDAASAAERESARLDARDRAIYDDGFSAGAAAERDRQTGP